MYHMKYLRDRIGRWLPEQFQPPSWREIHYQARQEQREHGLAWLPEARAALRDTEWNFREARESTVIVTGCNTNYLPLALDMSDSLRRHEELREIPLVLLDFGLEPVKKIRLQNSGAQIVDFPWPVDVRKRNKFKDAHRAHLAKERLIELVPGYQIYVWVDADIWFQTPIALKSAIAIASKRILAIVPEIASNPRMEQRYRDTLGRRTARRLRSKVTYNGGFFANHIDSPFWALYRNRGVISANLTRKRLSDQAPLNEIIHLYDVAMVELPPTCNWLCSLMPPLWNSRQALWLSPEDGSTPISAMHLTDWTREKKTRVETDTGESMLMDCRYSAWKTFAGRSTNAW